MFLELNEGKPIFKAQVKKYSFRCFVPEVCSLEYMNIDMMPQRKIYI